MRNDSQTTTENVDWRDTVTWYTHQTVAIRLTKLAGGMIFRPLVRVECVGLEHLPASGACILASNHINIFDVIYMGLYLPRHPHFMAKIELYKYPVFNWLIRMGGSFPIYRGESDAWAMRQADRVLAAGCMLFMFPEGTRSGRKARLRRGKMGAVKLALENRAPVVPAAITGTQNVSFNPFRPAKIKIQIGQPLDVAAMAGPTPYKHETMRKLTNVMMQRIAAMLPPAYRGVYARKDL